MGSGGAAPASRPAVLRLGIAGAAGRGGHFAGVISAIPGLEVAAICDPRADRLADTAAQLGAPATFTDYEQMLAVAQLDAVFVATPMPLHVAQSIAALESGRHVLCEVPAAVGIAEARDLVRAVRRCGLVFMMAENYGYSELNQLVGELVRRGDFGEVYYGQGEYLHEFSAGIAETPWRRHWQAGLPGLTYPTHSLGPLLDWMPGDRVVALTVADTGSHRVDESGQPYHHDSATLLGRTGQGRQVVIRQDLLSPRPHALENYQLQGTHGAYESSRGPGDPGRIWTRTMSRDPQWAAPAQLLAPDQREAHLPGWYLSASRMLGSGSAGHGGSDFYTLLAFVQAVRGEIENPLDIDRAMDLTLPGLVSQDPRAASTWLEVPDSRLW